MDKIDALPASATRKHVNARPKRLPNSATLSAHRAERGGVPDVVLSAPVHLDVGEALRESWGGTLVAVREDRHVLAVEGCSEVRALHAIVEEVRDRGRATRTSSRIA